jgi:hypothetical protein
MRIANEVFNGWDCDSCDVLRSSSLLLRWRWTPRNFTASLRRLHIYFHCDKMTPRRGSPTEILHRIKCTLERNNINRSVRESLGIELGGRASLCPALVPPKSGAPLEPPRRIVSSGVQCADASNQSSDVFTHFRFPFSQPPFPFALLATKSAQNDHIGTTI